MIRSRFPVIMSVLTPAAVASCTRLALDPSIKTTSVASKSGTLARRRLRASETGGDRNRAVVGLLNQPNELMAKFKLAIDNQDVGHIE